MSRLRAAWGSAKGPVGWIVLGGLVFLGGYLVWQHRHDHSNLHALVAIVQKLNDRIAVLEKAAP